MSRLNYVRKFHRQVSFQICVFVFCFVASTTVEAQENLFTITGEVKDQFGGLVVNASVDLTATDAKKKTTASDSQGVFRFDRLTKGKYILEILAEGFTLQTQEIILADTQVKRLSIVLYPTVSENVEVKEETISLNSEQMTGTQILTAGELENLPDDPDEFKQQLKNLASSSGSSPEGAIISVDGFLTDGRLPSKSAIREVRVNPNIYSAEYDTPPFRGGRIEIFTKPGAGSLGGSAFINYNGTGFNARNPFAVTRADTQTKRYGFQLGAPIVKDRAGFFADFEKRDIDEASAVNAVTLGDNFQTTNFITNVPNPQRLIIGSARNDWQVNKNHTLVFRYDFNFNKAEGLGVGGINLPSRAFDNRQTENGFRFSETAVLNPRAVNELRVGSTFRKTEQDAASDLPIIGVVGAFTSGGADLQKLSLRERRLEISDNLIVDAGKHILKIGAQIFYNRTSEFRRENQNGTFFFGGAEINDGTSQTFISGLEQYRRALQGLPGGVPTRFSVKLGSSRVSTNQWLLAGFVQDEWKLSPKTLLSLGLRAEAQTLPADEIRFAPRLGIAYSPDKKQKWIFRARAGVFYERIDDSLAQETKRLDGIQQRQMLVDAPSFPNPFLLGNPVNSILTRRILDPHLRAPASLQMRLEMEHQLTKDWKISMSHSWTYGWSQFRSRNINAPMISEENPNPQTAPRPFGISDNIFQFESSGRIKGRVLYVGVNQNSNKYFTVNAGYLFFDFKTDADDAFYFPQSSYDLSGEWSRPFWQSRHRVFLSSTANLPWELRLSTFLNAASGTPFNITTGQDNNGDGIFNDRPDLSSSSNPQAIQTRFGFLNPFAANGNLPRNIGTNSSNVALDLNLSRTFTLKKEKDEGNSLRLTTNVRSSNVLNRTNPRGLNGVLNSPFFGRAFSANSPRRVEFGFRLNF